MVKFWNLVSKMVLCLLPGVTEASQYVKGEKVHDPDKGQLYEPQQCSSPIHRFIWYSLTFANKVFSRIVGMQKMQKIVER